MLYKKQINIIILLLIGFIKQVYAGEFLIRILNESCYDYAKVEIFIYPENFVATYQRIIISDIKANELIEIWKYETEFTTPLSVEPLPDPLLEDVNLDIMIIAMPSRSSKYPSYYNADSILKKPKMIKIGDSYGLKMPHMEIRIDKSCKPAAKFRRKPF